MFSSRKAKGFFVSLSDDRIQVARTSSASAPLVLEEVKEGSGLGGSFSELIKSMQVGRLGGGYVQAVVGTYPSKRLVRRHTIELKRAKETGYLSEVCAQQFRIETDNFALSVIGAGDGTEFDASSSVQKDVVFCGLPAADIPILQADLLANGLYPLRLELGSVASLGGLADCLAHSRTRTPVLMVELGAETTHSFIVSANGVEASRPIGHGHSAMIPLVQKELGLGDEDAARKLLFSNTFDFSGLGPVLLKRLVADLQSSIGFYEVQTGQSVGHVFVNQLPPPLGWLDASLAATLGLPAFRPETIGWLASRQITVPDALAATARDPRWFGLLSLMVQTNFADAVPVQEKK